MLIRDSKLLILKRITIKILRKRSLRYLLSILRKLRESLSCLINSKASSKGPCSRELKNSSKKIEEKEKLKLSLRN